ncbi:hypothetical protein PG984_012989 [Apiospora sp. TS-2023a]
MVDVTETDEERQARQPLQGIPPAPPLPTSPLTSVPPPPPPPPGTNNAKSIQQSIMASKFAAFEQATAPTFVEPANFQPRHFFFHGTLMDPEVYQTVTKSAEAPMMRKGWITGFRMKMWGIYPTLVPRVPGSGAGSPEAKANPEAETDIRITGTYCMPIDCTIITEEGEELTDCSTFGWAGDPESAELEDGVFDFERYQKYFKPSVVKRPAAP